MKNVIFIAPPAAGKGTLSDYLVDNLDYLHISTGDLLRNVSKSESELGIKVASLMKEGKFIGDDIIIPLFKEELLKIKDKPFILDGMPRNITQAKYLDDLFEEIGVDNYVVINIDIDQNLLEKRAVGRRICSNCKSSYNIYFDEFKPLVEETCNKCNEKLIQRDDDTIETFKNRYETYLNNTEPLISFYKEKGLLKILDANKNQDEIINDLLNIIKEK